MTFVKITTYGNRINSLKPKHRELFVEAVNEELENVDLTNTVNILIKASSLLSSWKVQTPTSIPWYRVKACQYCQAIVKKRFEKHGTTYGDWWFQHCKRHAAAEFLGEISIIDNKTRVLLIDLEEKKIVIDASTNRHYAGYTITRNSISATLDGTTFTYKPHINSYPFAPAYNVIIKHAEALLDELINVLQNPHELEYKTNIYFNDQLIYEVK